MHCVVRVENWKGETIKGATNLPPKFKNGEQLNRLIAIESDLRAIAQEFTLLLNKCKEYNSEKYCTITVEIALDEEVLVPETTVKVPDKVSTDLRILLLHIKEVCIDQMKDFLEEKREDDKHMSIVSYEVPSFFKGDIYSTLFH
ncbi:MAG: hypothetical protein HFJ19_00275 [Clostridia bacterium]|nr:hypothetical protein [Clostridia bacterium]